MNRKAVYLTITVALTAAAFGIGYYRYRQYDISQQDYFVEKYNKTFFDCVRLKESKAVEGKDVPEKHAAALEEVKNMNFQIWDKWHMEPQELTYRFNQRYPWKSVRVPESSYLR